MLPNDWERWRQLHPATRTVIIFLVLLLIAACLTSSLLFYVSNAVSVLLVFLIPLSLLWFLYRVALRKFWRMYHLTFVRGGWGRDAEQEDLLLAAARRMHEDDERRD